MTGLPRQKQMDFQAATIRSTFESLAIKSIDQAFLWALFRLAEDQNGDKTTYQGSLASIGEAMVPPRKLTSVRSIKDRLALAGYISIASPEGEAHIYQIEWQAVFGGSRPVADPSKSATGPLQKTDRTPPNRCGDPSGFVSEPLQKLEGTPPKVEGAPLQKTEGCGGVLSKRAPADARHPSMAFKNSKTMDPWAKNPEGSPPPLERPGPRRFPSNVSKTHLRDPLSVQKLYAIAVELGWVKDAELPRIAFFCLAAHCASAGKNPGGLFRSNLLKGRWYGRDAHEEWARRTIAELDRSADLVCEQREFAEGPAITADNRDQQIAALAAMFPKTQGDHP